MLKYTIGNFAIFLLMVPFSKPVFYCKKGSIIECNPCETIDNCDNITNEIKVINYRSNNTQIVDYGSYVNGNIKIIKELTKITFYSCDGDYFQVSRNNYYPLNGKLQFKVIPIKLAFYRVHMKFQESLERHCRRNSNNFISADKDVYRLDFVFRKSIRVKCLQNITTATIISNRIIVLKENRFFQYAYNLVHLQLEFQNLQSFSCFVFRNLSQLRIVEFPFTADIHIESYKCILPNNRNLAEIKVGNTSVWNTCDQGFGIGTKCLVVATETILLDVVENNPVGNYPSVFVVLIIVIVSFAGIILFFKMCRSWSSREMTEYWEIRRNPENIEMREMTEFRENRPTISCNILPAGFGAPIRDLHPIE